MDQTVFTERWLSRGWFLFTKDDGTRLECKPDTYKAVLERNANLEHENDRIQRLNTTLQSRIHEITLRVRPLLLRTVRIPISCSV
jgi:hypothetical protein